MMTTSKLLMRHMASFLMLPMILLTAPAVTARPGIFSLAQSKGINVTGCTSCHNSPSGGRETLKPNYLKAYRLDTSGLSRLKNLINGCAKGLSLNRVTFICERLTLVSGALGAAATGKSGTDVYIVSCGPGTDHLTASVKDNVPVKPAKVGVKLTKGAVSTPLSTDARDGDALFSPAVKLAGKNGNYMMSVSKSTSGVIGPETYTANYSCRNKAGSKTAATIRISKNQ